MTPVILVERDLTRSIMYIEQEGWQFAGSQRLSRSLRRRLVTFSNPFVIVHLHLLGAEELLFTAISLPRSIERQIYSAAGSEASKKGQLGLILVFRVVRSILMLEIERRA